MTQEIVSYNSSMTGAPSGALNSAGGIIAVLDACLINGFNVNTISTLTQSGGVALATTAGTNGYAISDWVEVTGATPAAYNGRVKVLSKPAANQFTYAVPGGTASPASGTMSAKYPGAGWTKAVLGTNIAAYQDAGLGHWLQVEDNNPYADANLTIRTRICSALTALDTVGAGGTLGNQVKHSKLTGGWMLFADARTCYLFVGPISAGTALLSIHFGEFASHYPADGYPWFQNYGDSATLSTTYAEALSPTYGSISAAKYFPFFYSAGGIAGAVSAATLRGISQVGGNVTAGSAVLSPNPRCVSNVGWMAHSQDLLVPSLADNTIPVSPVFLSEWNGSSVTLRGRLRGMHFPLGGLTSGFINSFQRLDNAVVDGVSQPLILVTNNFAANPTTGANRQICFQVDGAWL